MTEPQTPEEIADKVAEQLRHVLIHDCTTADYNDMVTAIAAALRAYGDARAAAENRACEALARERCTRRCVDTGETEIIHRIGCDEGALADQIAARRGPQP